MKKLACSWIGIAGLVSCMASWAYTDIPFVNTCFNLRESQLLSNYQHCDNFPGRGDHYPKEKLITDGKAECVCENWNRQDDKYIAKKFGWFTLKNGKRQGPAEFAVSHYYLGGPDRGETTVKFEFENDKINGAVVVTSPADGEKCEVPFTDGKVKGVIKVTKGGKLLGARYVDETAERSSETFVIEFCKSGQLAKITCDRQSHVAEDQGPCGFGAKEPVKLSVPGCQKDSSERNVFWVKDGMVHKIRSSHYQWPFPQLDRDPDLNGNVTSEVTPNAPTKFGAHMPSALHQYYYPNGKPLVRYTTQDEQPVNELLYFSEDGKKLAEAKFRGDQGEMIFYAEYFLNGEPKILMKEESGKKTRVLRKHEYDESLAEDCLYADTELASCGYYNPKCRQRETLRVDLGKYGLFRGDYLLAPVSCRILQKGQEVGSRNYKDGYLDGSQTDIDREEGLKQVSNYKEGTLVHVKTTRLSNQETIEEYHVLKDGSKEYKKRRSPETAPRRGT